MPLLCTETSFHSGGSYLSVHGAVKWDRETGALFSAL